MSDLAANPALGIDVTASQSTAETTTTNKKTGEELAGRRRARRQKLLISLLPVIITGATFVLSFSAQLWQQHVQSLQTRDSEWRKALQQVSSKESETAIQGAYEMESFLDDPRYSAQACAIAAALLPSIKDRRAFDLIFFNLIGKADQENQSEFIAVDVALTDQLEDEYSVVRLGFSDPTNIPKRRTFRNFLMHPDQFYGDDDSEKYDYVFAKVWELDTVSHGLARLWSQKSRKVTPDGQQLDGIILFNNDFSMVDFRRTREMDTVQFIGGCKVNRSLLPSNVETNCEPPAPDTAKQ